MHRHAHASWRERLVSTAGRDIISAAKVELAEGSSAKASQSRVARASGISATNTLQATAGRDVTLTGSGLLTGGDASITAGHDITVGSAVTFMERHAKRLDESSTTNHGSAVAVGGNLAMTAGNDLTVAGSTVVAQNNAVLAAARNLSVTATQDTYSFHMRSSKSGGLGKSSSAKRNILNFRKATHTCTSRAAQMWQLCINPHSVPSLAVFISHICLTARTC